MFHATCVTPDTGPTVRRLAEIAPSTLAVVHGSSFAGDGRSALLRLADSYDARLAAPGERGEPDRPCSASFADGWNRLLAGVLGCRCGSSCVSLPAVGAQR